MEVCVCVRVCVCVCVVSLLLLSPSYSDSVLPPSQVLTDGSGQVSVEPFSSFHVVGLGAEEALGVSQAAVVTQGPDTVSQLTVDSTLMTNEVRSEYMILNTTLNGLSYSHCCFITCNIMFKAMLWSVWWC